MESPFRFSLAPVDKSTAPESARPLLASAEAAMGMVPNMYARMALAPGLLGTYMDGYRRFREESGFTPAEQEVVFLTISKENGCEYCVAAHSFLADKASAVDPAVTDAIRDDSVIPDPALAALSTFTRHLVATRGRPTTRAAAAFLAAGYRETQILYVLLAVAVKTISNYSNHMFETPLDAVFAARAFTAVQS